MDSILALSLDSVLYIYRWVDSLPAPITFNRYLYIFITIGNELNLMEMIVSVFKLPSLNPDDKDD